ncbi:MAG: DUF4124 domain-containing protein [Archangium sp.]|nr:DUF4124 domain-containing protein [Archangium sp.]
MRSLTLLAVIAVPAFAQTVYTWEDDEGIHYTDDASQVPKQQKKVEGRVIDARPASSGLVAPKPATVAVAAAPAAANPRLTEYEWRDRFINAHRRIDTLKQGIAALQASVPPRTECIQQQPVTVVTGTGVTVVPAPGVGTPGTGTNRRQARCQVNPLHDQLRVQIAQQQVELSAAEVDLEQLDRRASMEAVPREWRRGW